MKEVLQTLNKVKLHWAQTFLQDSGIESYIWDENMGNAYHGMFGVAPRLMVSDEDYEETVGLLRENEKEYE